MVKTICILSGGMDSTTLLYSLLKEGREVKAISFDYGQKHKRELELAAKTCNNLAVEHKIVDVTFLKELLSNSALTSDKEIPEGHYEDESMKDTVVPNRNMIMASIAIGWAINEKFEEIALGVHSGDHAIYPDCRPEFINALREVAKVCDYRTIGIYTPFLTFDKGGIAAIGKDLEVDYSLTHTCYNGEEIPCGKCGACQERAEAFKDAELTDPLI